VGGGLETPMTLGSMDAHQAPAAYSDEPLNTRGEVAKRWKVHPRTIDRMIARGDLPAVRIGGLVRILEADLEALIQRQRITKS